MVKPKLPASHISLSAKQQQKNKPMLGVFDYLVSCLLGSLVARAREKLKILGDSIRQYRKHAGFSQERLAEKADLHPVYIGKVERGEQWISLHALLRVAEALGVRASELIRDL